MGNTNPLTSSAVPKMRRFYVCRPVLFLSPVGFQPGFPAGLNVRLAPNAAAPQPGIPDLGLVEELVVLGGIDGEVSFEPFPKGQHDLSTIGAVGSSPAS